MGGSVLKSRCGVPLRVFRDLGQDAPWRDSFQKLRLRGASAGWQGLALDNMAVNVRIPTPLRKLTGDEELVQVQPGTIATAFAEMQRRFPGIQERLMDEGGQVRRFVNVYVNEEDIRFLQNQDTALKDGDEVSIIPAIAGG